MKKSSLALGLSGASISLALAVFILLGVDWMLFPITSGLAGLPVLIRGLLGVAGAAAGFIGCALLNKHHIAAGVLMISGGVSSLFSLFLGFIPFLLLAIAGICAFLPERPAANPNQKANSPWITILFNTIAIFIMCALVLIFRDSLKSDSGYLLGFGIISYSVGVLNAILLLHIYKKRSQRLEQAVHTQPGDDSQKEKTV